MKLQSIKSSIYLLFAVITFSSCSTDDDSSTSEQQNQQAIAELQSSLEAGDWKITKFMESDEDELYHFTGYTFNFNENGVLVATNGTNTYTGTWSITTSNSNDDSNDNSDLDFNIMFNETNAFEDLNDDWDILSRTANKVELRDVSGGDGDIDLLTFEKI